MDSEQARIILSAYRPDRDDAEDPVFAEAFAQMELDPALAEWFATEQLADTTARDAFSTIQPPANLREQLLASKKVIAFPSPLRFVWLAAAAAIVVGAIIAIYPLSQPRLPFSSLVAQVPALTNQHDHALEAPVAEMDKIRSWLAANGGAADFTLPTGLQNAEGVACEVIVMDGAKVSILCFNMGHGRIVHLYITDRSRVSQPPPEGHADISQQGDFAWASWSDASHSYILAQRGVSDAVRGLL